MGGAGAAAAYYFLLRTRRREQPALPFPEFVRISRPEIAAPAEAEVTNPTQPVTPTRRALPSPLSPFRRGGGRNEMTPEQRMQMQLVTDFVQSIPLLEVAPDLEWMEELVIMLGGNPSTARDQLLAGGLEAEYSPMWMQHPTFMEMQSLEDAAPLMAGLNEYAAVVNECSSNAMSLIRRIDGDLENAGATDILPEMRWRFVMSVAQSTTAWFRGLSWHSRRCGTTNCFRATTARKGRCTGRTTFRSREDPGRPAAVGSGILPGPAHPVAERLPER